MDSASDRPRGGVGAGILGWFGRLVRDRRGNIAAMTALLLIPLAGIMGMAVEGSGWLLIYRAEQNAADSAALAAATNGGNGGTTTALQLEAQSVASSYGFADGLNNTTVSVPAPTTYASVTPCATTSCYRVTITKSVPIFLLRAVGYSGTNGNGLQTIKATALATTSPVNGTYCIVSLASGSGDQGFYINGGSMADFSGCYIRSNSNVICNGNNSSGNAAGIVYTGSNKNGNCQPALPDSSTTSDPYANEYGNVSGNIPSNTCSPSGSASSYPQEGKKINSGGGITSATPTQSPPAANLLSGSYTWGATQIFCGDVELTGNVTINSASPGTLLVIENGMLDLNGYTLMSAKGSGLTIIFTGPSISGFSPWHVPSCSGTLDIAAPTSGTWSGVAVWQDKSLTSGVDMSCSGNQPTWDIQGLVYMPNANLLFGGVVDKYSDGGLSCFSLVDYTYQANGTDTISEGQSQCGDAGLSPPTGPVFVSGKLVY